MRDDPYDNQTTASGELSAVTSVASLRGSVEPDEPTAALSPAELATFGAVADAFFPSLPGTSLDRASATGLGVRERLPGLVARLPHEADRLALRALLRALGSRVGGFALHGRLRRFDELSSMEAEALLLKMGASPHLVSRQAFKLLRQLTTTLVTWAPNGYSPSPLWEGMRYPGPLGAPPEPAPRLAPIEVDSAATWTCDAVVVGSGAGGGVAAGVLAKAGLDVVVLEKGGYHAEHDFTHYQHEADRELYAARTTTDLGVALISGACLGGGTVVNYSTSLPTPPEVREEWDHVAGFTRVFTGDDYARSLDAVMSRGSVTREESTPWARDRILERGAKKLGWRVEALPRNVRGCAQDERCGFCNFGCRLGAKQSTLRTWLEEAGDAGARMVVRAEVERVIFENGRAVGVRALVRRGGSKPVPLTVFARHVVLACGALYTPVLLQRSGLRAEPIGRHLRLHPVTGVWGLFDERTDPWGGVMQARIATEHADLDGHGYGFRFESGALHPAEFAALHGWGGATDFKRTLSTYSRWAAIAILLRDSGEGRVHTARAAWPGSTPRTTYEYALSNADVRHVREGVRRAAELLAAAGAREIRTVSQIPAVWRPASGEPLERFSERAEAIGFGPCQHSYGSYHQMGSARMGKDPRASACDERGRVHGVEGLYVMDASCFPTASGVNPMMSIEAIAHLSASRLAAGG